MKETINYNTFTYGSCTVAFIAREKASLSSNIDTSTVRMFHSSIDPAYNKEYFHKWLFHLIQQFIELYVPIKKKNFLNTMSPMGFKPTILRSRVHGESGHPWC